MSRPVIEMEAVVRPEWIDFNGHLNLAYYVVVFDLATDAFYTALGIGDAYRDATGFSCFTAETHTLYEREVHLGDKLLVRAWLLGADAKRVHYFHEMFHAESGDRSAAQELMALHIDMSIRRAPRSRPSGMRPSARRCRTTPRRCRRKARAEDRAAGLIAHRHGRPVRRHPHAECRNPAGPDAGRYRSRP